MKIRRVVRYTNTVPTLVCGWISPRFWNHLVQQQQRYSYSTILQCLTYSQLIIHCWKLSRSVTQHFCARICVFAFLDHSFTAQIYLHWSPLSSTNLRIWTKANRTRIFNFESSVTGKYRYKFLSGYLAIWDFFACAGRPSRLSCYLAIWLSGYLASWVSVYLAVSQICYLAIWLSGYLAIWLSGYLAISVPVCLSFCLSVCLPLPGLSSCLSNVPFLDGSFEECGLLTVCLFIYLSICLFG